MTIPTYANRLNAIVMIADDFDDIRKRMENLKPRISVPLYGMTVWGDLFTARQKVALVSLIQGISEHAADGGIGVPLALAISRCAEQTSSLVRWRTTVEAMDARKLEPAFPVGRISAKSHIIGKTCRPKVPAIAVGSGTVQRIKAEMQMAGA